MAITLKVVTYVYPHICLSSIAYTRRMSKRARLGFGGCNFFASSPFLPIFSATDAPRGGLYLLFFFRPETMRPSRINGEQTIP